MTTRLSDERIAFIINYGAKLTESIDMARELLSLRQENKILREGLGFYADKNNWTIEEDYSGYIIEGFITSSDIEYPPKIPNTFSGYGYGGKEARSTLAAADKVRGDW